MYSVNVDVTTSIFTAEETRQVGIYCVFVTKFIFEFLIKEQNVKIQFNSKNFWKNQIFFKAKSETHYHLPFQHQKSQSCFLFLAEQIEIKHFLVCLLPFSLHMTDTQLISIVWTFS